MNDYLNEFNTAISKAMEFFQSELRNLKTGRATPSLIENINVSTYGTMMPLIQLASITAPEANMLIAKPWDKNNLKDINKSLQDADLGATCVIDGDFIRVKFSPLTEERRLELVKKIKVKLEETKVKIKNARDKVREQTTTAAQSGDISEDEKYSRYEEIDELTKKNNELIKELSEKKEKEIMTI